MMIGRMGIRDQFDNLDLAAIQAFLGCQEENLHLDFKQIDGPTFQRSDDRKNLVKVLSGFANSDGGICIWGVDARKDASGADVAQSIVEIPQVATAISRLNELTPSAVNPLVDGVVHKAIPTLRDAGVVATLVPQSDSGPHMAKLGEDRYYKRSGGSFMKLEHFDLEDMFGRRAKPVLSLHLKAIPHPMGAEWPLIYVAIRNSGRAVADGPFLAVKVEPPYRYYDYGVDGNRNDGLPRVRGYGTDWRAYGGSSQSLVYPGIDHDVVAIDSYLAGIRPPSPCPNVRIHFRLAAANARLTEGTLEVPGGDLV